MRGTTWFWRSKDSSVDDAAAWGANVDRRREGMISGLRRVVVRSRKRVG
jgi:hypothetical protein